MLQEQRAVDHTADYFDCQTDDLRSLAYRSVATSPPTEAQLSELLRVARKRNKNEGLSGVLLSDRGAFFQWLEGPSAALERVWDSISRDPRHRDIRVLRDEPTNARLFEGWDLRVAQGPTVSVEAAVAATYSTSKHLLKDLAGKPGSIFRQSWDDIFATSIIPRLLESHADALSEQGGRKSTSLIWHAALDSGAELAGELMALRSAGTARYVDSLIEQGAGFNALYHEVFEPAQLHMGKLWDAQRCDDFHLTLALARLQVEVRRVNAAVPGDHACKPGQSVLLCPQPSESHSLGLVMSSELFDRNGWAVTCEFPRDDRALVDLIHGDWFDVLKLSQSGALRRDSRLLAMRTTIDAVRFASLNPELIVMVDGRTFSERPQVHHAVHANAVSRSVLEAVPTAERMLSASRSRLANVQVSTG